LWQILHDIVNIVISFVSIICAILPAVDNLSDLLIVALISQGIQVVFVPEPSGGFECPFRFRSIEGIVDEIMLEMIAN